MQLLAFLILALYIIGVATAEEEKLDFSCLRFCTINFYPVCASNGACVYEFKNKCTMHNNNCESKKKNKLEFKQVYHAQCYSPENPCQPEDIALE